MTAILTPQLHIGYRPAIQRAVSLLQEEAQYKYSDSGLTLSSIRALDQWTIHDDVNITLDMDGTSNAVQNALLRMIETPRPGVQFVLTATSTAKILDTIVSRCLVTDHKLPAYGGLVSDLMQRGMSATNAAATATKLEQSLALSDIPDEVAYIRVQTLIDAARQGDIILALKTCQNFDSKTLTAFRLSLLESTDWQIVEITYQHPDPIAAATLALSEMLRRKR